MSCIFCQIVAGKIPSQKVYETEDILAFKDANPQAPVHVLIIPKKHASGIDDLETLKPLRLESLFETANEMARRFQVHERGYRLVVNCKSEGGQTVDHLHLHLLGGRTMHWPPG